MADILDFGLDSGKSKRLVNVSLLLTFVRDNLSRDVRPIERHILLELVLRLDPRTGMAIAPAEIIAGNTGYTVPICSTRGSHEHQTHCLGLRNTSGRWALSSC